MAEIKETVFECSGDFKHATITSNEQKWINKIKKLKEQRPEEVDIICLPEDNQGCILVHVPKSWMKLSPPRTVNYTEEQKEALRERMANARKKG
jgi:hypothetical protein